jgi:hypothetical protein
VAEPLSGPFGKPLSSSCRPKDTGLKRSCGAEVLDVIAAELYDQGRDLEEAAGQIEFAAVAMAQTQRESFGELSVIGFDAQRAVICGVGNAIRRSNSHHR